VDHDAPEPQHAAHGPDHEDAAIGAPRGAAWLYVLAGLALAGLAAALLAPYLEAEYLFDVHGGHPQVLPMPRGAVTGRWFDDYFVVQQLDADTYAIGEPRYYQGNYSYLILGSARAVLFDAGTGLRDIVPVVRSLTRLPVTVIPSHLHFDHVGALGRLDHTALPDLPALRSRAHSARLTLGRYEFLGFADRLAAPTVRVDEWWAPETTIDLGGRQLLVLATPGHTPTSVSLYDGSRHELFAGDFIYPGELYAFLPGASRADYRRSTRQLLARIDPATRILAAHMEDPDVSVAAPVLRVADLRALDATLAAIEEGHADATGFYPRVFAVRGPVKFATGWTWNNR
jgi:hydroxyacylglutathione hydrolase